MIFRTIALDVVKSAGGYALELLAVVSGVGAIMGRSYGQQYVDVFQVGAVVFSSLSMVDLRQGIKHVHLTVTEIAARKRRRN